MADNNENNTESDQDKEKTLDIPQDNFGHNTFKFALVTVLALIFSLGSLTVITSRQATLADNQSSLANLQSKLASTMLLSMETLSSPFDKDNALKQKNESSLSIVNEVAALKHRKIENEISKIKHEISYGDLSYLEYVTSDFSSLKKTIEAALTFRYFSSDALLGMLLISCGVIGAVTSALRGQAENISRVVVLGASVGFVALLGVKGGSTIFILTNAGMDVPFNAYSTAFVGILAGMFSEKLYLALSKVTDRALNGKSANK